MVRSFVPSGKELKERGNRFMSKKPKRTISKKNHAKWEPYLFLAPVCILLLLMFGMPLINSIVPVSYTHLWTAAESARDIAAVISL